jgi:hypothetical protein
VGVARDRRPRTMLIQRCARYQSAATEIIRRGQAEGAFREDVDRGKVAALILVARDGIAYHALSLCLPADGDRLHVLLHSVLQPCVMQHQKG